MKSPLQTNTATSRLRALTNEELSVRPIWKIAQKVNCAASQVSTERHRRGLTRDYKVRVSYRKITCLLTDKELTSQTAYELAEKISCPTPSIYWERHLRGLRVKSGPRLGSHFTRRGRLSKLTDEELLAGSSREVAAKIGCSFQAICQERSLRGLKRKKEGDIMRMIVYQKRNGATGIVFAEENDETPASDFLAKGEVFLAEYEVEDAASDFIPPGACFVEDHS